jgi:bacillithiol system protein YtxJ
MLSVMQEIGNKNMAFVELNSIEKLNELFEKSDEKPVVLFKHSITCPISSDAASQMSIVNSDVNIVIVQTSRPISNEIENRTNIRHESPQLIILKDGKPIFNASHYSITADKIEEVLSNN